MGARLRAHPWPSTPLGAPEAWAQPLKTLVVVMLAANQPMFIAWGPQRTLLYNDAYAEILAGKHPGALGGDFLEVWSEIRAELLGIVEEAYAGRPVHMRDIELWMERRGYLEEAHFAFSYTPVPDETGAIGGFFCPCRETTREVLEERRRIFRLGFEERLRDLHKPGDVMHAAATLLGEHLGVERAGYGEVLADDATIHLSHCYAKGVAPLEGAFPLEGFGPSRIARQRRGETEVCADVLEDAEQDAAAWAELDTRAFVSVPLIRDGGFKASLYVNARDPRRWSGEEVALIEEVAARTWDAVNRAVAEDSLRQSEARFRLMADASPQIAWVIDAEGRAEYFNRRWYDYTGVEREPLSAGQVSADFVHPDDAAPTMAAFEAASAAGEPFLVEHRIRSASGGYRWFLVRGEPYRDPRSGEITRWFGASVDIHDRREAEAALRESELRYRSLFENIDSGFCVVEVDLDEVSGVTDYRVIEANPAFYVQTGFPQAIFGEWLRAAAPTLEEHWFESYARVARSGVAERFEQGSGHLGRWFDVYAFPMGEAASRRVAILFNDISDRRRAEERLRAHLQQMPGFVAVLTGPEHRFEYVNDAYVAVSGERDYIGHTVRKVFPELEDQGFNELLDRVFETGEAFAARAIGVRLAGRSEERQLDLLYQPIFDNGAVSGIFVGGYDITERVQAEQALHALTTQLEQTVAERTADLSTALEALRRQSADRERVEEALRQSQKMEAMGQLTGGVAHDFNNLLMPIIGSLDMLVRRELGSERERRLIDGALQSAERAKILVQRLLAFARRQPLQARAVDVRQLVTNMADLIDSTTGPRVDVRVELGDGLPAANADPNQLEMAILNLAVNARDAMPDGGVLTIAAAPAVVETGEHADLAAGAYVRLSVSDTGFGMDEATIARAIEPFFSTKGIGRGTGLGLSMVHGLALQLGGALTIDSQVGEGATITLWLPATASQIAEQVPPERVEASRRALGTALLVDDEELVRMTTADMLMDLGYEVVEAASGEEALRLLDEGLKPALLVTDHIMPGVNGATLARRVRGAMPALPILIVSGYAEADGLAPDLVGLTKPFRNADLSAKLVALGALPQA